MKFLLVNAQNEKFKLAYFQSTMSLIDLDDYTNNGTLHKGHINQSYWKIVSESKNSN